MLSKDYIMRMVEQIVRAMAKIAQIQDSGDFQAAQGLLDQACREHLGLELALVQGQPVAILLSLFTVDGQLDPGKCIVAGELSVQIAAQAQQKNQTSQAEVARLRALEFYMMGYRVLPEKERHLYAVKIVDLLAQLPEQVFAAPELLSFVAVYEAARNYDRAEDLLFELAEEGVDGAVDFGLRLYQELLRRKDDDLEQGGLPREEVEQGLQELRRMAQA